MIDAPLSIGLRAELYKRDERRQIVLLCSLEMPGIVEAVPTCLCQNGRRRRHDRNWTR